MSWMRYLECHINYVKSGGKILERNMLTLNHLIDYSLDRSQKQV